MKINEAEQLLGISKANIRFYEKQHLLTPDRAENGYREYSQADIERLKTIIVMRKLGISVQNIGRILNSELSFQDAIQNNIKELEAQIEELEGALELSRRIASDQDEILDTQRYWDIIQEREAQGERFVEIVQDYWTGVLKPTMASFFCFDRKHSVTKIVLLLLAYICIRTIIGIIYKNATVLTSILYWPLILIGVIAITFPIYLIGRKHSKAAGFIVYILSWFIILFIALLLLVIVVGLIVGAIT